MYLKKSKLIFVIRGEIIIKMTYQTLVLFDTVLRAIFLYR